MAFFLRIAGIALIAFGLFYWNFGNDLSETFSNRFLKEMSGDIPSETKNYLFGGVVMIIAGAACLLFSFYKKPE